MTAAQFLAVTQLYATWESPHPWTDAAANTGFEQPGQYGWFCPACGLTVVLEGN